MFLKTDTIFSDKLFVFIDKRDFEGPLYEQIEEAYKFVLKHINLGAEINGLVRTDSYELPTEAIREAIVNATTHRNFLDRACVQVAGKRTISSTLTNICRFRG